jgi:HK97 family phage prohead protease
MEHKSFSLGEFKALGGDAAPGTFEALVAVFGNVDFGGDRIERGAFTKSLGEWAAKGRNVPVLWSHDKETVPIGVVEQASETPEGLRVKARLFIDDNPLSRSVHAAMKGGALQEFSFGYGARDYKNTVEGGRKVRVLKELHLGEISPVFAGMNPATRLEGVKSRPAVDVESLDIDQLKALADLVNGELGGRASLALKEATPGANPPPEPTPVSESGESPDVTPVPHQEPEDKPDPNPADAGEEGKARIRQLQAEQPFHLETER